MKKYFGNQIFLSIIGGLFHCLAFAPFNSILSAFISICIYYYLCLKSETKKQIIKNTLLFGVSYHILSLHWIVNSLLIDAKQWWFLIPPTLILIPFFLSLYYLIVATPFFYFKTKFSNKILQVFFFSLLWSISELARSHFFTGFPWNLLGTVWLDYESISQIIYYTNTIFLGFLTIFLFLLIFNAIKSKDKNSVVLSLIIVCSLFIFIQYDEKKLSNKPNRNNSIKIRIVQPNIPQQFKWDKKDLENIINTLDYLSFKKNDNFNPHLIIWPETAWPFPIDINDQLYDSELEKIIKQLNSNQKLISGIIRIEDNKVFNSAIVLTNSNSPIQDVYDKIHLVPFGEYIPLYESIKKLLPIETLDFSNIFSNLSFGKKDQQNLETFNNLTILPLICYEGIFPYRIDKNIKFAVNLTNDAWFGNSFGPHQHLRMVRSQAIQYNIPVIRAANTGISAVINNRGQVVKKLDLLTQNTLDINFNY